MSFDGSRKRRAIIVEDPSLPQLKVAKDPGLMREVFQRYLRPLDGRTYQVRECQISFISHRKGVRCKLQYALRLEEAETGRELSQLVTGVMEARQQTQRTREELRRSEPGQVISRASEVFAPFFYISDLDMLVEVFPYDSGLPALSILMAGPPPELEASLLARFGSGGWQTGAWNVEPVRYRTNKRATLRVRARVRDAATGRAEEKCFYAKVYRETEEGDKTYRALQQLWDRTGTGEAGFTVGRPITYLSGLRTLVQEEVSGTPLKDILLQQNEAILAVRRVASALASLHLSHVVPPRRRGLKLERALLEEAGPLLRSARPHLGPEIEEIVGALLADLKEVPPAPTHGDLKLHHILLDDDRLYLLDLDFFARADPILDVANILAQLTQALPRLSFPHDRQRAVAHSFTEEYFARVPEAWRARLPPRYASILVRKAAALMRNQVSAEPGKIDTFIHEAKDSLAGKIW